MSNWGRAPRVGMPGLQGPGGQLSGSVPRGGPGSFNGLRGPPPGWNPHHGGGSQQEQAVPPVAIMEHRLATMQAEMQQLLTENQKLTATLMGLRQELPVVQGDVQRMQQAMVAQQADKEANIRILMEKHTKIVEELRATETLKQDLHTARVELQALQKRHQEAEQARLTAHQQVQGVTEEFQKVRQELSRIPGMRQEIQQIPPLRQEVQGLRQELQQTRAALEYEKKVNAEHMESRQAMETNLVSMARENEKRRAELTNVKEAQRASAGNAGFGVNTGYGGNNGYGGTGGVMAGRYTNAGIGYSGLPSSALVPTPPSYEEDGYGVGGAGILSGHTENGVGKYGAQPPAPPVPSANPWSSYLGQTKRPV